MKGIGVQGVIRRTLAAVILVSLILGVTGMYVMMRRDALDDASTEARLLLATGVGVRQYTDERIAPLAASAPPDVFHEETVPSFAAQTVFRTVSQTQHAFTYREAALNPTAPADRASDFEVGLIQRFRADPKLAEISGDRSVGADRVFYLARPIRITDPACIVCHDTPARAPPAMIAKYGPANGFGWKLNEVVGVQQLSLPVTEQFRDVLTLAVLAGAGLTVIFLTAYLVLASALEALVARPLTRLAEAADRASTSGDASSPLPASGVLEIGRLSASLQRLRVSLAKAMAELERVRR